MSDVPANTRARVIERDRRCRYCGATSDLHLHHINYRSQGVDHSDTNLIVLCGIHHALVHSSKRHWQPILRAYIWIAYVEGRRPWLPALERQLTGRRDAPPRRPQLRRAPGYRRA